VYAVLVERGRVLLMRRAGSGYRDGELSLPAGHLDGGEDAIAGLRRELREELGVDVDRSACRLGLMLHRAAESPDDSEYIDFIFEITEWCGTPIIAEPTKCTELVWVDPSRLPDDVVDYIAVTLTAWCAGERLVLHGWDNA